jgi:hypothetical protein
MAMSADAAAPVHRAAPRWWSLAAWLFAAGFGAVALVTVGVLAQGNWLGGPRTIAVPMSAFDVARGHAAPSGTALVIDAVDATQTAIVSARVAPFAAASYSRVDWKILPTVDPRPGLALAWVTREQPGRTLVKPLQWQEAGVAPLEVAAADGWVGTITGLALVVRGPLPQPVVVQGVTLPGISAASMAREVLDQWAERRPWGGGSVTYPFDAERDQHLSLPAASALALALAGIGYVALARKRRWPLDARVFFALFLGGWLLLDARWQVNLWRQQVETARQFAGRSLEEKYLASADAEVYALAKEMRGALPATPARVIVLSDHLALRARAAYFLHPHSANGFYEVAFRASNLLGPDDLPAGAYAMVILSTGIAYDRAGSALVWRDGRRRAVDEVLYKNDGVALLRIR